MQAEWRPVVGVIAVFLSAVPYVTAQEAPAVAPDTRVWVTTADRQESEGTVVSISPSTLVLRVDAAARSIPLADVRRIETRDSLRNGIVIGGVAGAASLGGFAAYLSQALCEISDGCFPHDLGPILALAGIGAGIGIASGGLIDFAIKGRRAVYSSDGSSLALHVAPMMGGRGAGIRFSVTWPP